MTARPEARPASGGCGCEERDRAERRSGQALWYRTPARHRRNPLGTDEYCTVDQSLDRISAELGLAPERHHGGGERGRAVGSPLVFPDCTRIRDLGWRPKRSIRESVVSTPGYVRRNRRVAGAGR